MSFDFTKKRASDDDSENEEEAFWAKKAALLMKTSLMEQQQKRMQQRMKRIEQFQDQKNPKEEKDRRADENEDDYGLKNAVRGTMQAYCSILLHLCL